MSALLALCLSPRGDFSLLPCLVPGTVLCANGERMNATDMGRCLPLRKEHSPTGAMIGSLPDTMILTMVAWLCMTSHGYWQLAAVSVWSEVLHGLLGARLLCPSMVFVLAWQSHLAAVPLLVWLLALAHTIASRPIAALGQAMPWPSMP